jgi:large subunit ribosomal protein L3
MLNQVFVYKHGMTQAWTADGKRVPVTRLQLPSTAVVRVLGEEAAPRALLGVGTRQMRNLRKPQRSLLEALKLDHGVRHFREVELSTEGEAPKAGDHISLTSSFEVGDVIEVQGVSKGKGFAGVMKRHNFHGGSRTHGQSDRARAPGSIGQRTTPGRVHKGKRMAGRMGTDTKTVKGLVVLHIDTELGELWVSGPVPGHHESLLRVTKSGQKKEISLDATASNLPVAKAAPVADVAETPVEVVETPVEAPEVTPEATK